MRLFDKMAAQTLRDFLLCGENGIEVQHGARVLQTKPVGVHTGTLLESHPVSIVPEIGKIKLDKLQGHNI